MGDIILDSYEFGAVKKISPEAPMFKSLNEIMFRWSRNVAETYQVRR